MNRKNLGAPTILFIFVLVAALLILMLPGMTVLTVSPGQEIYGYSENALLNDYLIGILWAFVCGISIFFWRVPHAHKRVLLWGWSTRTFVCLVFMLFYERYYGFDTDGYFVPDWNFTITGFRIGYGQNNVRQLTWLLYHVVPISFHAAKVTFSMIGLFSTYLFYKAAIIRTGREDIRLLYVFCLIPSVLLWSSLLGKDPICLLGMALYVYGVCSWYSHRSVYNAMLIMLGMAVSIFIRPWFGLIMAIPLALMILRMRRHFMLRGVLVAVIVMLTPFFINNVSKAFKTESMEELIEYRRNAAIEFEKQGSGFKMHEITNAITIVLVVPYAIFTALFRPLPWEAHNPFAMLVALENSFLLILLFRAIRRSRLKELLDPFVLWLISLTCMWAVLYGLVSYNFGALVRFKLQILPVLVGLLLLLARKRSAKAAPSGRPRVPAAL